MIKIFKSFRARLIFLVLIAVIPALGVTLYSGLKQRDLAAKNVESDAYQYTRQMANYQSTLVEGARQVLLSLSLSPLVSDPAACNTLFISLKDIYPMYSTIAAARPDGQVYCSTLDDTSRPVLSDRDYFIRAVQTGEFSVGEVVTGRISHETVIPMALPVLDDHQNSRLILLASIDMEKVLNYIDKLNLPENSAMLVVDQTGKILMRYSKLSPLDRSRAARHTHHPENIKKPR